MPMEVWQLVLSAAHSSNVPVSHLFRNELISEFSLCASGSSIFSGNGSWSASCPGSCNINDWGRRHMELCEKIHLNWNKAFILE